MEWRIRYVNSPCMLCERYNATFQHIWHQFLRLEQGFVPLKFTLLLHNSVSPQLILIYSWSIERRGPWLRLSPRGDLVKIFLRKVATMQFMVTYLHMLGGTVGNLKRFRCDALYEDTDRVPPKYLYVSVASTFTLRCWRYYLPPKHYYLCIYRNLP
jgi:hypothetical protein